MSRVSRRTVSLAAVVGCGMVLAGAVLIRQWCRPVLQQQTVCPVVMGTTSRLTAVGHERATQSALAAAEEELARLSRVFAWRNPDSELGQLNVLPAGVAVRLSPHMEAVIGFGQAMSTRTGGAFDATVLPLCRLWSEAGRQGELPDPAAIDAARQRVGFGKLALGQRVSTAADGEVSGRSFARKLAEGVELTLDAIAKGYAVDRSVGQMRSFGLVGGLVEVGGDLRCFGRPADRDRWRIGVQSPWDESLLMAISPVDPAGELAVCTSGNYRRFVEIDGRRYSHIMDPRTGQPADAIPSVTVIAPDTMTADGWATALSVLTIEEGRGLIEAERGIEAMWVTGTADRPRLDFSRGFEKFVVRDEQGGLSRE